MKSLIKMLWVLTFAMATNALFAIDADPGLKFKTAGPKSFALYLDIPVECTAYIRITDREGKSLLRERFRNVTTLSKKINLSNLPEGTYFLEVEDRLKIKAFTIEMSRGKLHIQPRPEEDYHKPVFQQKGKYVDMCMLLLPAQNATVSVFSPTGRLVIRKDVENTTSLEQRFNVTHLERGTYSFVVTAAGRTFTESLRLR